MNNSCCVEIQLDALVHKWAFSKRIWFDFCWWHIYDHKEVFIDPIFMDIFLFFSPFSFRQRFCRKQSAFLSHPFINSLVNFTELLVLNDSVKRCDKKSDTKMGKKLKESRTINAWMKSCFCHKSRFSIKKFPHINESQNSLYLIFILWNSLAYAALSLLLALFFPCWTKIHIVKRNKSKSSLQNMSNDCEFEEN